MYCYCYVINYKYGNNCCQAQPQLNSTSTKTKAEVSFILRQIQPPTHPSRIVVNRDLSVNFYFNSNKRWVRFILKQICEAQS